MDGHGTEGSLGYWVKDRVVHPRNEQLCMLLYHITQNIIRCCAPTDTPVQTSMTVKEYK
jgi:hypothetical protein